MSFGFAATGDKADVVRQLGEIGAQQYMSGLGQEVAALVGKHLAAGEAATAFGRDPHEWRYVVKASGHGGGGSPLSLNITVESIAVRLPASISGDAGQPAAGDPAGA